MSSLIDTSVYTICILHMLHLHVRYFLDLSAEQEAGFAENVLSISLEAGFEPCMEVKSDGVHAIFIPQKS